MARGFVGSRRMKPFFSNVWSCECTLEVEVRPTSSQLSRIEGGYPRSLTASRMNSRMRRCLVVSSSPITVYPLNTRPDSPDRRPLPPAWSDFNSVRKRKQTLVRSCGCGLTSNICLPHHGLESNACSPSDRGRQGLLVLGFEVMEGWVDGCCVPARSPACSWLHRSYWWHRA